MGQKDGEKWTAAVDLNPWGQILGVTNPWGHTNPWGQVLNYQISNQLNNQTHARVMQLEMLGQFRHGVGTGGKGGLNCGVAVVGV